MAIQPIQLTAIGDAASLAPADSCGCGGGSCAVGPDTSAAATTDSAERELLVEGMTCDHCVNAVTEEISAIDGVDGVAVELVAGGSSRVRVRSSAPIAEDALRGAVEEAGYRLA